MTMTNDRKMDHQFHDLCAQLQRNEPRLNITSLTPSNQAQLVQLGRSLVGNTYLKYLCFGHNAPPPAFDNTDDEDRLTINEVTEALANGFRHSQVQTIRLMTNLEFNVMQHIQKAIRKVGTIRELFISGRGELDLHSLAPLLTLQDPTLRESDKNCRLVKLTLSGCNMHNEESIGELAPAVNRNSSVQTLNLDRCVISDDMVATLISVWDPESPLMDLHLSCNWISLRGAQLLMRTSATTHLNLKKLNLKGNKSIGYAGLALIADKLVSNQLIEIRLGNCVARAATDDAVLKVSTLWALMATAIRQNTFIQKLYLSKNGIDSAGVLLLLRSVTNHPSMITLELRLSTRLDLVTVKLAAQLLPTLRLRELYFSAVQYFASDITPQSKKAYNEARHALVEGVQNNFYLCELTFPWLGVQDKVDFYLDMNRLGRLNWMQDGQNLSPTLWCCGLDKLNGKMSRLYYEHPWLMTTSGSGARRGNRRRPHSTT